jgi:hypothetical protein
MKPFLLKLDQDVYTQWASAAKLAGLTLSEWIRRAGNAQLNGGNPRVEISAERYSGPVGKPLKLKRPFAEKADKIVRKTDAAIKTSDRTGHPSDCECFQCTQTARFLKQQAKR